MTRPGALVAGLVLGHPWPALALAALTLLAAHLLRLRRIMQQLDARVRLPPPRPGGGAWTGLERLLRRSRSEFRDRERRLVDMMRAYRAVATALPDALVVVDRNTQRLIWCNAAAEGLLGLHYPRDKDATRHRLQPCDLALDERGPARRPIARPFDGDPAIAQPAHEHSRAIGHLARDVGKLWPGRAARFVANVSHDLRTRDWGARLSRN